MKRVGYAAAALVLIVLTAAVLTAGRKGSLETAPGPPASGVDGKWIDFTLPEAGGEQVTLREFIGKKPVLLIFWATWCPHCNKAVPAINRMHSEPPTRDTLAILAVDYMESREKVQAFISSKKVALPVLLDRSGSVARKYKVVGIPTYVLLDRDGKVAYRGHEIPEIARYLP